MRSKNSPPQAAAEPFLVDIDMTEPQSEEVPQADPSETLGAEPHSAERPHRRRLGREEPPVNAPQGQEQPVDTAHGEEPPVDAAQGQEPPRRRRLGEEGRVPAPAVGGPQRQARLNEAQAQALMATLRSKQSLTIGLLAGAGVALAGAVVWAIVTVVTNLQIGWMAVGVGFLVGSAVRAAGKGIDKQFGYLGAGLALCGCLLGNLLSLCAMIAHQESLPIATVLTHLNPAAVPELMALAFHPMDLLFYAIAVYEGYRFSFRNVTQADVERLTANQGPQAG